MYYIIKYVKHKDLYRPETVEEVAVRYINLDYRVQRPV